MPREREAIVTSAGRSTSTTAARAHLAGRQQGLAHRRGRRDAVAGAGKVALAGAASRQRRGARGDVMPLLLDASSTMMCPHGGTVTAMPAAACVRGRRADQAPRHVHHRRLHVCAGVPHPCVIVQWVAARSGPSSGDRAHRRASACASRRQAPQGVVMIQSTQPRPRGSDHAAARLRVSVPDRRCLGRRQASYPDHVDQMIRQVLLNDPGERVCLPEFGAGCAGWCSRRTPPACRRG